MQNELCAPRFVTRRWPMGFGWIFFLVGGLLTAIMVWAIPVETDPFMLVVTYISAAVCAAATLVGLRFLLMPLDRVWAGPEGVRLTLLGLTLRRIPRDSVRSVVGRIREIRLGLEDKQIYNLYVYYTNSKGKERCLLMERTDASDLAFQTYLSHTELLM